MQGGMIMKILKKGISIILFLILSTSLFSNVTLANVNVKNSIETNSFKNNMNMGGYNQNSREI